jgi:hypothetical protein
MRAVRPRLADLPDQRLAHPAAAHEVLLVALAGRDEVPLDVVFGADGGGNVNSGALGSGAGGGGGGGGGGGAALRVTVSVGAGCPARQASSFSKV